MVGTPPNAFASGGFARPTHFLDLLVRQPDGFAEQHPLTGEEYRHYRALS